MMRMEDASKTPQRGQQRRAMLAILATSADKLSKLSTEDPEAFGEMRDLVEVFYKDARALADFAQSATIRLAIADCREEASHG